MAKKTAPHHYFQKQVDLLASKISSAIDDLLAQVKPLNDRLHQLTGSPHASLGGAGGKKSSAPKTKTPTKAKRTRRSSEDVTKEAHQIIAFVKSKGKEGVSGSEIKAKFGEYNSGVKNFVKSRTGITLKSKGASSNTRYFAD